MAHDWQRQPQKHLKKNKYTTISYQVTNNRGDELAEFCLIKTSAGGCSPSIFLGNPKLVACLNIYKAEEEAEAT